MGEYCMKRLRDEANKNLRKRVMSFNLFGNVSFSIRHMHDNEYAVFTVDPVVNREVEILRLYSAIQPTIAA